MKKRPNILFLLTDGMQGRMVDPLHPCRTPNFDSIAKQGVRFSRAYTPTPVCSPARASLMTGLLAHNHGVLQVEHCVDPDQSVLRPDKAHWAQRLSEDGYRTGYFGKWHIERTGHLENFGWQVYSCNHPETRDYRGACRAMINPVPDQLDDRIKRYQTGPEGYQPILHYAVTDVPAEKRSVSVPMRGAQKFLVGALKQDQPWCCFVSLTDPNEAMICGRDAFNLYPADRLALPPNLNDDLANRPALYRRVQKIWKDVTPRQWREALACYYGRITEIDRLFGRLLKQVEESNQTDNTIIVVSSDHGKYVGGHGMEAHNFGAFEEIYHIPLLVRGPGIARGVGTNARVGLHDLCSTILELTGAKPIPVPDSRSFAGLLANPSREEKNRVTGYGEYHGTRFSLTQRVFWDGPWKLVFNGFDLDELYNLEKDPHEMNNLAGDPAQGSRVRMMMKEIWRKVRDTNDRTLRNSQYYPMRFPAIGPDAV